MLDFRINTFLTVCKYMNFTRAAGELNITQPAVSQHIRCLEESYQTKLFDYQSKKLCLTDAGKFLRDVATTMKHDDIYVREKLRAMRESRRELVFGVTLTVGEFVIPEPVSKYLKQYPDTTVKIVVANTKELLRQINNGEIDFALVEGFFPKNEYDSLVYSKEKYIAVCGPDYQFEKPPAQIEDTFSERLIVREAGSGTREILERYLESRNLRIRDYHKTIEISNLNTIKTLVAEGCGITFLYEAAARRELVSGELKQIHLKEFEITHDFTFIWRRNSVFSNYYKELFLFFSPAVRRD